MVVVVHQAVGEQVPVVQVDGLVDELQQTDPICVALEDALLAVAPDRDVIEVAKRFESQRSCHDALPCWRQRLMIFNRFNVPLELITS